MLGHAQALSENPPTGFLVGLFSLLDALLGQSMLKVVEKLPLGEELKAALCGEDNNLRQYLNLIEAYEVGHWKNVCRLCTDLQLDEKMSQGFYHEAIRWGSTMQQISVNK